MLFEGGHRRDTGDDPTGTSSTIHHKRQSKFPTVAGFLNSVFHPCFLTGFLNNIVITLHLQLL